MFTLLVVIAVLLLIGISLGVYYRRRGNHTNLIFMFLTLSLAAWSFTNYLAITIPQNSHTIYAIRTVLLFALILMYCTMHELVRVIGKDKITRIFFGPMPYPTV